MVDAGSGETGSMRFTLVGVPLPVSLRMRVDASDEELLRLSRENPLCKIERNRQGEITVVTPLGGIGSTHEVFVASALYVWSEADGRGIAFGSNAGFNLRDASCLSPDAAWVSLERWNALTAEQQAGFPPLCPEFIVEVRSRTDSRRLLEAKMELWLENAAELAWLVDPVEETVRVHAQGEAALPLARPESVAGRGPVSGFSLRTGRLWTGR